MPSHVRPAAVVIGRNEGDRLVRCLTALREQAGHVIYVDSGSTDLSVQKARKLGVDVLALDMSRPFTAARARNAGFAALGQGEEAPDLVQFVDGDCTLHPDWMATAAEFLHDHPQAAVVFGRLREVAPEASVYNRLADSEWNGPIGQVKSCGGIAMMRTRALAASGGYDAQLIAGEEPELCVRLRSAGWTVWRIDADMGWHDLAMTRFGQWWRRTHRGGFAAAQGAAMHGAPPERHKVAETRRALLWGVALPLVTVLGALITPWALALLLIWPLQILRLRLRGMDWARAGFLTLGRFPEGMGVLGYGWSRLTRRRQELIEYR